MSFFLKILVFFHMVITIPSYSICVSTLFLSRNFWRQSKLSDLFSNHTCPLLIPWRHQERSWFMALTFSTPKNSNNYHFKCPINSNAFCTYLTWNSNFWFLPCFSSKYYLCLNLIYLYLLCNPTLCQRCGFALDFSLSP